MLVAAKIERRKNLLLGKLGKPIKVQLKFISISECALPNRRKNNIIELFLSLVFSAHPDKNNNDFTTAALVLLSCSVLLNGRVKTKKVVILDHRSQKMTFVLATTDKCVKLTDEQTADFVVFYDFQ